MITFFKPRNFWNERVAERIKEVSESGVLSKGEYVLELEQYIEKTHGVKNCISCSSCTQGLFMVLGCALNLREYKDIDTIYLPSFTWMSTYLAAHANNLKVRYLDIDKETWLVEDKPDIKAIIPVDTFGNIMDNIKSKLAIWDSAHSLCWGTGRRGLAEVFSLAPTKSITACEGGIITTNNDELAEDIRRTRDICSRMSEIHAIIALENLEHIDEIKKNKSEVVEYYKNHLPFKFQKIPENTNYSVVGCLCENKKQRDNIIEKLNGKIEFRKYYEPLAVGTALVNTSYVYDHILCLPSYYGVDYKKVVEEILKVI